MGIEKPSMGQAEFDEKVTAYIQRLTSERDYLKKRVEELRAELSGFTSEETPPTSS